MQAGFSSAASPREARGAEVPAHGLHLQAALPPIPTRPTSPAALTAQASMKRSAAPDQARAIAGPGTDSDALFLEAVK